jgi:hypothetical protein
MHVPIPHQREVAAFAAHLDQGYTDREILTECLTYGAAGMATTREFIVMAAWHLFEREDLRRRFLEGDDAIRLALLEEILRLEPVVGALCRRTTRELKLDGDGTARRPFHRSLFRGALLRQPGIHNHRREYGFRPAPSGASRNDGRRLMVSCNGDPWLVQRFRSSNHID